MHRALTEWITGLDSTVKLMAATWSIVAAMMITGMFWVHNNHTRTVYEGATLVIFYRSHGVHPLDIVFLVLLLYLAFNLQKLLLRGLRQTQDSQKSESNNRGI